MVSEFRNVDDDDEIGGNVAMPVLDNSATVDDKPTTINDNNNNFGPAVYKPSHNRAHDVVQYESQRWRGHVLEFSVSKRSKTNLGTIFYNI